VRDETVARSYAEALLELAERNEGLEPFSEAVDLLAGTLREDGNFQLFLETPRIDAEAKKDVLRHSFADRVPSSFLKFMLVVVDKRRQRLFGKIAEAFNALVDERLGRTHVDVTVSRPLEAGELASLTGKLSDLLDRKAIPHVRVDPGILGGVIIRAGDTIYDGSLRRRLERMRTMLLDAELPAAVGGDR
jgi:F-type H+-transporting ATPase subunit delta